MNFFRAYRNNLVTFIFFETPSSDRINKKKIYFSAFGKSELDQSLPLIYEARIRSHRTLSHIFFPNKPKDFRKVRWRGVGFTIPRRVLGTYSGWEGGGISFLHSLRNVVWSGTLPNFSFSEDSDVENRVCGISSTSSEDLTSRIWVLKRYLVKYSAQMVRKLFWNVLHVSVL